VRFARGDLGGAHRLKAVLRSGRSAAELFGEQAGLRGAGDCRGDRGLSAGNTDHAENRQFGESRTGNEDAVGGRVEIGRRDLHAVIQQREQVVGDDAFEDVVIEEAETNPKSVEFGTAEEGFALGLKVVRELANEINGAHLGEGNLLVLAVGSEEVDGIGMAEARGIHIAVDGFPVGKDDHDLLVRRGWGPSLQGAHVQRAYLRNALMYVMLIGDFLSSHCFHWG